MQHYSSTWDFLVAFITQHYNWLTSAGPFLEIPSTKQLYIHLSFPNPFLVPRSVKPQPLSLLFLLRTHSFTRTTAGRGADSQLIPVPGDAERTCPLSGRGDGDLPPQREVWACSACAGTGLTCVSIIAARLLGDTPTLLTTFADSAFTMAEHKEQGNHFFSEKRYDQAIACYEKAIVSLNMLVLPLFTIGSNLFHGFSRSLHVDHVYLLFGSAPCMGWTGLSDSNK